MSHQEEEKLRTHGTGSPAGCGIDRSPPAVRAGQIRCCGWEASASSSSCWWS